MTIFKLLLPLPVYNSPDSSTGSTTTSAPAPASPTSADSGAPGAPPSSSGYDKISSETSSDPDTGFMGLGDDYESSLDDLPASIPAVSTKPPVAAQPPQVPATPPVAPAAAAPQPPAAPAAPDAGTQPPAEAPAATATPTDVPPADVDSLIAAFDSQAAEIFQQVAPQFNLTPEQITELETDAANALPKLLATTYMKSIKTAMTAMQQLVPQMIQKTIAQQEAGREMESAFFKQWNQLDRSKHGNDIRMFAKTFSAANPRMTQAELFSLVGAAVMAKNGLAMSPTAPAAAAQPAMGFTPAVASAPVTHQKPVDDSNPFSGMGRHFDEE
jgi:hypothetical protein